jgi:hypothetical protein
LIYIGDHQTVAKHDELNSIIKVFKKNQKAIHVKSKTSLNLYLIFPSFQVNCHLEVDELFEDLNSEILKHI